MCWSPDSGPMLGAHRGNLGCGGSPRFLSGPAPGVWGQAPKQNPANVLKELIVLKDYVHYGFGDLIVK